MLRRATHWCLILAVLAVCGACSSQDEPTPSPTPILTTSCPRNDLLDIAIAQAVGEQSQPKVALARDGSAWVAWYALEDGGSNVRAQRLDRDGNASFASSGLLVTPRPLPSAAAEFSLAVDDYGSAILAVSDARDGDLLPYAYKLTPAGEMAWGKDGIRLAGVSDDNPFPRMALSQSGEPVFVWENVRAGGPARVVLQRLSKDGDRLWGDGLIEQGTLTAWLNWAWLAPSDGDAVILVWAEAHGTQDAIPTVYARKLDNRGQQVWPADVVVAGSQIIPYYRRPVLEPDGAGGVFVAWPSVSAYHQVQCLIQHLTASGQKTWSLWGMPASLSNSTHQVDPSLAYVNETSELMIVWSDTDLAQRHRGLRAQRIALDGTRRWGDEGIELVPVGPYIPDVPHLAGVRAATGGAIVVYSEQVSADSAARRVLGARLRPVDAPAWSPVVLSRMTSDKGLPALSSTRACGAWAVWQDGNADAGDIRGSFFPAN